MPNAVVFSQGPNKYFIQSTNKVRGGGDPPGLQEQGGMILVSDIAPTNFAEPAPNPPVQVYVVQDPTHTIDDCRGIDINILKNRMKIFPGTDLYYFDPQNPFTAPINTTRFERPAINYPPWPHEDIRALNDLNLLRNILFPPRSGAGDTRPFPNFADQCGRCSWWLFNGRVVDFGSSPWNGFRVWCGNAVQAVKGTFRENGSHFGFMGAADLRLSSSAYPPNIFVGPDTISGEYGAFVTIANVYFLNDFAAGKHQFVDVPLPSSKTFPGAGFASGFVGRIVFATYNESRTQWQTRTGITVSDPP